MIQRILIAEDEPIARRLLGGWLTTWGWEVTTTSDGVAALAALERDDAPPIAILDWMMPGLDGIEVCRRIRQRRDHADLFVLLLSARAEKDDLVAALDAGADDYIVKPFHPKELRARLDAAARRRAGSTPSMKLKRGARSYGPGDVIAGRYEITERLGAGGMGAVFGARHLALGTEVAIKLMLGDDTDDAVARARFKLEARAAWALRSDHVAKVHDYGVTPTGEPYIVMERLRGVDLYDEVTHGGPLAPARVVQIVRQVADGLQHAHDAGVLHRDIKPENIFLARPPAGAPDAPPIAKLVDFGLAKTMPITRVRQSAPTTRALTYAGMTVGTPQYMSPEQVRADDDVGPASDLWALAACTYFMLLGKDPFRGKGIGELSVSICSDPLPVPSQVKPGIPRGFDAWFARACERDPKRRFTGAREMAAALEIALLHAAMAPAPMSRRTVPDRVSSIVQSVVAAIPQARPWVRVSAIAAMIAIVAVTFAMVVHAG